MIVILSCDSDNDQVPGDISGNYVGTFERDASISNVELYLRNGTFQGESDTEKFPAICNGSYSISEESLEFTNACAWTAEFDWSLILSETWNYRFDGNRLTLVGPNGDRYKLTKK